MNQPGATGEDRGLEARSLVQEIKQAVTRIAGSRGGRWTIIATATAVVLYRSWFLARGQALQDFSAYRRGAWGLAHLGDPYSLRARGSLLPFIYPPFAAIVLLPFGLLPLEIAQGAMSVLSFASLATILVVLIRSTTGWGRSPAVTWSVGVAVLIAVVSEPVWLTLGLGQINLPLMAAVVIDIVVLRDRRSSGVLTGVATGIKITPAIFIVYLLLTGRWRAAATAAATAVGTIAVSLLIAPKPTWHYFADRTFLFSLTEVGKTSNQSLDGGWSRLFHGQDAARPWWIVTASIVAIVGFWAACRLRHRHGEVAGLSLAAIVGLVIAPTSWTHYWIWWMAIEVVLVTHAVRSKSRAVVVAAIAWPIPFYFGRSWFPPYDELPDYSHGFWASALDRSYVVAGLIAIGASAWYVRPKAGTEAGTAAT